MRVLLKRNFLFVALLAVIFSGLAVVFFHFNYNINYTPSDIKMGKININKEVHAVGTVAQGSLRFVGQDLSSQFVISDDRHKVNIIYNGKLPLLFHEGKKIIAFGSLSSNDMFLAKELSVVDDKIDSVGSK